MVVLMRGTSYFMPYDQIYLSQPELCWLISTFLNAPFYKQFWVIEFFLVICFEPTVSSPAAPSVTLYRYLYIGTGPHLDSKVK